MINDNVVHIFTNIFTNIFTIYQYIYILNVILIYVFFQTENDTITVSGGSVAGGSGSLEGKIVIVTSGTKFQVPIYLLL